MPSPSPTPINGQAPPPAIPAAVTAALVCDAEEREVVVANIDPKDNARKYFDPEQLNALADNIAVHGLLNALIIYLPPESGRFRLIAGERRLRAVQLLGWKTVRCRVLKEPPDESKRRELALIDNVHREGLSDIELGLEVLGHITQTGSTATALAQKIGKHVSTLTRAMQLAQKLPGDLHDLIRSGKLPPFAARHLTHLPDDDSKRRFAALYCEGKVKTAAELAAAIKSGNGTAAATQAGFSCEESGVRIAVLWNGNSDTQALTQVENALRIVLKDLAGQKQRGVEHFKTFLEKKAKAAKKAAELKAAQDALAGLANPTASIPPTTAH